MLRPIIFLLHTNTRLCRHHSTNYRAAHVQQVAQFSWYNIAYSCFHVFVGQGMEPAALGARMLLLGRSQNVSAAFPIHRGLKEVLEL